MNRGIGEIAGVLGIAAAAALVVVGVARLFALRFESGDIYPPYSTLRADPLGAKAYYDSLAAGGLRVSRNYRTVSSMDIRRDTAFISLGESLYFSDRTSRENAATLMRFMRGGGRLVLTFLPRNWGRKKEHGKPKEAEKVEAPEEDTDRPEKKTGEEDAEDTNRRSIGLGKWWELRFRDDAITNAVEATLEPAYATSGLPFSVSCHTSLWLEPSNTAWKVVYRRGDRPVVMERAIDNGTLVVSALSYFTSNEALKKERHSALLAWLVGNKRRVVFDEEHNGIRDDPGFVALARRYRLHGLAAAAVLLALLFVWQSSVGLVPASARAQCEAAPAVAQGKHSALGLVNILRRNIPASRLLAVCLDEWRATLHAPGPAARKKIVDMETAASRTIGRRHSGREVAETYNEMCRLWKEDCSSDISTISTAGRPLAAEGRAQEDRARDTTNTKDRRDKT